MSETYSKDKGLKLGINGQYSGKIGGLVFQKNGRVRINSQLLTKRRKKNVRNNS